MKHLTIWLTAAAVVAILCVVGAQVFAAIRQPLVSTGFALAGYLLIIVLLQTALWVLRHYRRLLGDLDRLETQVHDLEHLVHEAHFEERIAQLERRRATSGLPTVL